MRIQQGLRHQQHGRPRGLVNLVHIRSSGVAVRQRTQQELAEPENDRELIGQVVSETTRRRPLFQWSLPPPTLRVHSPNRVCTNEQLSVESEPTAGEEQFCELPTSSKSRWRDALDLGAELSVPFYILRAFALSWLDLFGLLQGPVKQQRDSLT